MSLAEAVGRVQYWLSEVNTKLACCIDRWKIYCLSVYMPNRAQVEQDQMAYIDKELEEMKKKMAMINTQLEDIWTNYVVHEDVIQLKNMVSSEHMYINLKNECKDFFIQYREVIGEAYEKTTELTFKI